MTTTHRVMFDLTPLRGVPRGCPQCGDRHELESVFDGQDTAFRCTACGTCWHHELGYVTRNDPQVCPSCPEQPDCLAQSPDVPGEGGR